MALAEEQGPQQHCHGFANVGVQPEPCSVSPPPAVTVSSPEEERKGEKIYLYTHLKQQPIW